MRYEAEPRNEKKHVPGVPDAKHPQRRSHVKRGNEGAKTQNEQQRAKRADHEGTEGDRTTDQGAEGTLNA